MSLKDPNSVNPKAPKRIAIVLSNPTVSTTTGWPVGFWWSELSHPYLAFTEQGYEVEIFSPDGGRCEADAMSDPRDSSGYSSTDLISMGFIATPALAALKQIHIDGIDVIEFAHGGIAKVRRFYDRRAMFEQLGLQVLVEPRQLSAVRFGYSLHASSENPAPPGIVALTWIEGRDEAERDRIREHSGEIVADFLKEPGFIGIVTGFAGDRGFTCTAWQDEPSLHRALDHHHARAKQEFRTSGLSPAVWTSVWKPHHINRLWLRCSTCERPNDVSDRHLQCTNCGADLPVQPAYW